MIVAHPDDEIIWGGAHLLTDDYYVVCVSNKKNPIRSKEFERVMHETGDKYIMLTYLDVKNGNRIDWKGFESQIAEDIQSILALKPWDLIVTHNPDGEYGNSHHKIVSKIVTDLAGDRNLYYFGIYSKNPAEETPAITDDLLRKKEDILKNLYPSKMEGIIKQHWHMLPYENWIRYEDWAGVFL